MDCRFVRTRVEGIETLVDIVTRHGLDAPPARRPFDMTGIAQEDWEATFAPTEGVELALDEGTEEHLRCWPLSGDDRYRRPVWRVPVRHSRGAA